MIQLLLHLIGDFVLQSHWMAENKTKRAWPALVHAVTYSLPFLLLQPSVPAIAVILGTHFLIDRFRLARYVVWFKNVIFDPYGWSALASDEYGNIQELKRLSATGDTLAVTLITSRT